MDISRGLGLSGMCAKFQSAADPNAAEIDMKSRCEKPRRFDMKTETRASQKWASTQSP